MNYLVLDTETADLLYRSKNLTNEDALDWGFNTLDEIKIATQLSFYYLKEGNLEIMDDRAKPEIEISIDAMEITNITNKDVEDLESLEETETFKHLVEIVNNDKELVIIGHNIDYDIDVLRRYDLDLSEVKKIDTLQVSKYLSPEADFNRLNYLQYFLEIEEETRKMLKSSSVLNASGQTSIGAHNSLYDVIVTLNIFNEYTRYLKRSGMTSIKEINERMIEMSITPFLLEEFPWGYMKGIEFESMNDIDILKSYKLDIDEMNFKYTMETQIEKRGGLEEMFRSLGNWHKEKMFRDQLEDITNPKLIEVVKKYYNQKIETNIKKETIPLTSLSFGKHKGVLFTEKNNDKFIVDNSYLEWLLKNNSSLKQDDRESIQKVLDERTGVKKEMNLMDLMD